MTYDGAVAETSQKPPRSQRQVKLCAPPLGDLGRAQNIQLGEKVSRFSLRGPARTRFSTIQPIHQERRSMVKLPVRRDVHDPKGSVAWWEDLGTSTTRSRSLALDLRRIQSPREQLYDDVFMSNATLVSHLTHLSSGLGGRGAQAAPPYTHR